MVEKVEGGRMNSAGIRGAIGKRHIAILCFNVAYLIVFTFLYGQKKNSEFLLYVGTASISLVFIGLMHLKYRFTCGLLLGLTAWGLMHMLGGYVAVGDGVLYSYQIVDRVLRFDQFVHAFGFGYATLFCCYLLLPNLGGHVRWFSVSVILVFAGMGVGALNEMIEFLAVLIVPETGVGGYDNTMWDIVFNSIGAVTAVGYVNLRRILGRQGG